MAWARARFAHPAVSDLDAEVHRQMERDPAFAVLLRRTYERRVQRARESGVM